MTVMKEEGDHVSVASGQEPAFAPQGTFDDDWAQGKKEKYNYDHLAHLVGLQPGFAIVRRFAVLNAKSILYLQAELAQLEMELKDCEEEDRTADDVTRRKFQWEASLLASAAPGRNRQWEKVLQIRSKLKEYNSLLLQQERLYRLPRPNAHDLSKLREVLEWKEYGGFWLEIPEDAWDERFDKDLVALSERASGQDRFDRWLTDKVVPFLHRYVLHRKRRPQEAEDTTYEYSDEKLRRIAEVVMMLFAASLPSVPIIALFYIQRTLVRLLFTIAFSFVFSIAIAYFTSARRFEIFAAVTALASVQVVFIGTSA